MVLFSHLVLWGIQRRRKKPNDYVMIIVCFSNYITVIRLKIKSFLIALWISLKTLLRKRPLKFQRNDTFFNYISLMEIKRTCGGISSDLFRSRKFEIVWNSFTNEIYVLLRHSSDTFIYNEQHKSYFHPDTKFKRAA